MFDQFRRESIDIALHQACEVLRDVGDLSETMQFLFAMLLLKYASDVRVDLTHEESNHFSGANITVPEGATFNLLLANSGKPGNGKRINDSLLQIESTNEALHGAFHAIDFDAAVLGDSVLKERVLRDLLSAFDVPALRFGLDGRSDLAASYACDSLVNQVAAVSRREQCTPPELSELIARLVQPVAGDAICDPCCGFGSILISCGQHIREVSRSAHYTLYGQEKNGHSLALAKINMALHGEMRCQLDWGDTLRTPTLLGADGNLLRFPVVVADLPFATRDWGYEDAVKDPFSRFSRGMPPRTGSEYAFISHMAETLDPAVGRMAAVVPHGVLFRGGAEKQIRKALIEDNLVDAVIALPPKLLYYTAIPVALLILRKNKADKSVLLIDGSRSFQPGRRRNILRPSDLDEIESTYLERREVETYSRCVTPDELAANDYNLMVTRYLGAEEEEVETDLEALHAERVELVAELAVQEAKLAELLKEIGHA